MIERAVRQARGVPWWRAPLYPLAVPLVAVLETWSTAVLHPVNLVRPLAAIALAVGLVVVGLAGLVRNRDLGALAGASLAFAVVVLDEPQLGGLAATVATGVALAAVVVGLRRRGRVVAADRAVTRFLTVVAAVLVATATLALAGRGTLATAADDVRRALDRPATAPPGTGPDVFVILLDGYPGDAANRLLATAAGAPALRADLAARGFAAPADTHANYLRTYLTLTSMFDLRHLADMPELGAPSPVELENIRRLRPTLADAEAWRVLREHGYETIALASGFAHPELRMVDRLVEAPQPTEFELTLLRETGLGRLVEAAAPDLPSALQRDRIAWTFERLVEIAAEPADRPRFVFAHVPAPHPPYVFGPWGEPRREPLATWLVDDAARRGIAREEALRLHLDQADHVRHLAIAAIDRILAAHPEPPVVVVFSDHGSGSGLDPDRPIESDMEERFSNVLAVLAPGRSGLVDQSTTPTALLPILFNAYLGTELAVPSSATYAFRGGTLDLVPVTLGGR